MFNKVTFLTATAFSTYLREARKKSGLSQQELADHVGVDRSYISQIERAEKLPATETLKRISNVLKIKMSSFIDLLDDSQEEINNPETDEADGQEWVQQYVSDTGARVYFSKEYLRKLSPKTWRQIAAIIKEENSEEE